MKPTLYEYWRSSSSWRVRWALAIKGVAYESVPVNLVQGEQHEGRHKARNPLGYVPTLTVDGRHLGESVAIIEYLDERYPEPPLFPRDPWRRARVRQVVELVNSGIQPMQNLSLLTRHSSDPAAQRAFAAHFNERGMEGLERLLANLAAEGIPGPFTVGDTLTAADLYLVPQVQSARRFGVALERFPFVCNAERAARATPHAEAARPEHQPGASPDP